MGCEYMTCMVDINVDPTLILHGQRTYWSLLTVYTWFEKDECDKKWSELFSIQYLMTGYIFWMIWPPETWQKTLCPIVRRIYEVVTDLRLTTLNGTSTVPQIATLIDWRAVFVVSDRRFTSQSFPKDHYWIFSCRILLFQEVYFNPQCQIPPS